MLSLAGRGAIIAGARRIGAGVGERLAAEGVRLAILYRQSRGPAEELLESAKRLGVDGCIIQADLNSENDVAHAVFEARRQIGDLSFCINLASDYPRVPFPELNAAAWEHGMDAAKGTYLLALHASRAMMANSGPTRGHLVFFGDWAAEETPYIDYLPYLTAKAAIGFMTRAFALELAPYGILVNAVLPGPTARPIDYSDAEWAEALADAPLHRESPPEEMAELVVTMLKLESMTGEQIRLDSGRHIAGAGRPRPML